MMWQDSTESDGFGGARLRAWPDGGSLLNQANIVVEMFSLIEYATVMAQRQSNNGS